MAGSIGNVQAHHVAVGGFYSALAGIVAAAMAAIIKWGSHAFSTEFLLAIRWGVGLLAFLTVCFVKCQVQPYKTSHLWQLCLIAATWVGAVFCCYFSVRFIPLPDAVLLLYTSPLFAPLLNWLFYRQTESRSVWVGLALGFIGVVIVLRPGPDIIHVPALIGLLAGLLLAVRLVINASIAGKVSNEVITFYSLALGFLLCLGVLALTGFHVANWERHLFPPRDWLQPWIIYPTVLLALFTLGVLSLLQPWFTTAAYEYASVGQASPFRYFGVIFAGLVDWLCWGQVPDLSSLLGFLFITVGVVWVIKKESRK
jgi:drug/metabolite transporter (DMT)-like permease